VGSAAAVALADFVLTSLNSVDGNSSVELVAVDGEETEVGSGDDSWSPSASPRQRVRWASKSKKRIVYFIV